ncbi:type I restriction endonuclease subunit R [Campylobacter sp. LH-2024]|uniref:type I restriction endonuclease subunit R n=1 Tax=Campylobacter sp. LH-2024 TaxID=3239825 RepID=UPI003AA84FD5
MTNYQEKDFEEFIESYLINQNGYIKRSSQDYDKNLSLDIELFEKFLQATQNKALEELKKRLGEDYKKEIYKRVSSQIQNQGMLKALQTYVEIKGVKIYLAFSKPNTDANEQSLYNYTQNIFSVVRQLYYSTYNKNSLDMVIFLNGLPIITLELKNYLTGQNVYDAINQYKEDRDPKEPIFSHSIIHFALDSDLCYMSTKLQKNATKFLPFNRGLNNSSGKIGLPSGAGNPPSEGMKTAYLWEEIFKKDTLMDLFFNFAQILKDKDAIIFPRYHQFDLVKKLLKDLKENGVGKRYLIQHSAGSGKSNSIAWLAHNLVSLHRMQNEKLKNVFDTTIVVTDRKILDRQIQDTIKTFENKQGVVEAITQGSKQLKNALEEGKKIIITTIQKFPYILDEVKEFKDKNFAIIIDEAHSSQGGKNTEKMSEVIRSKSAEENENLEDEIIELIKSKKFQPNASYFAFTATPKSTTLEMFGNACMVDGIKQFIPFHLYPMKQAIEEKFILDVLKGYTTYKSYYKIVSNTNENPKYDKKRANAKLKAYVQGNIEAIEEKSKIMIEHFFQNSFKKIAAKAKAMVVTSSRENAVKYYLTFKRYLSQYYPKFKAIVAFSGDLNFGGETYSESSLNGFSESILKEEFKKDEYRFLIVAQKYQTGFDEPLLHTMYVDKALSGISAVQTLSRLNRICQNKFDTFVLDFVNTHEDIEKSFSVFYEQTYLFKDIDSEDKIYDLKVELNSYEIYTQIEIDDFASAILRKERENIIHAKLDQMIMRFNAKDEEVKIDFYNKAKKYINAYSFLAQILPYEDSELEKLNILLKKLISKIILPKAQAMGEILDNISLEAYRIELEATKDIILKGNGELKPNMLNTSNKPQSQLEELLNIIKEFNTKQGGINFEEENERAEILYNIKNKIVKNEEDRNSLKSADIQNAHIRFKEIFNEQFQKVLFLNSVFFNEFNNNSNFKDKIINKMFNMIREEIKEHVL